MCIGISQLRLDGTIDTSITEREVDTMSSVTRLRHATKVVASYTKANAYLGEAQKTCNQHIRQYMDSDLTNDANADKLAYWRAELAGVRKLQAMALVIQG